tara:strand:+ start:2193 stop:2393 length:201 start_codon:yes stop_codon:yes gene_type:complete
MNEEVVWNELTGTLWQYIKKEHMEMNTNETITDEQWELFIHGVQDSFADEVSRLASDFWRDWGISQ